MSFHAAADMASSSSLIIRIAACAAQEGIANPVPWANTHVWSIVTHQDWIDAWDFAINNHSVNVNPDTGQRDDVINDSMILTSVQAQKLVTPT